MTITNDNLEIYLLHMSFGIQFQHLPIHDSFRLHPPSKSDLQNVNRAVIQAWWVDYQCKENTVHPDSTKWGWTMRNGSYFPVLQNTGSSMNINV